MKTSEAWIGVKMFNTSLILYFYLYLLQYLLTFGMIAFVQC